MRLKMIIACCVGLLLLLTVIPSVTHAAVPKQINYQGYLTDSSGNPVPDGDYGMLFAIYDTATLGTALWSESQTVTVTNGIYNVILGQPGNELDPNDFDGDRYLGITVDPDDDEMTPRQKITSTAFALKAEKADSVADGAVTSIMIGNGAVTTEKVADNAVTTAKIVDGTVTAADIADGSGSGLNADKLDGLDSSAFITSETDPQVGNITRLRVPYWNGSELVDSSIYEVLVMGEGLRNGIDTENPQARLHVNAPHNTDGLILGPPTTEWAGETYRMRIRNGFGDGFLQTASGGPQFLLSYNSYRDNDGTWHATYPAYQSAMVNLSPGTIRFQTGTDATNPDVTTHMKIQSDGHVIVGADTKHLSMYTDGLFVDIKSTGSPLAINYPGDNNTLINVDGGRVGIGTNNPQYAKLHVTTDSGNTILAANSGTGSYAELGTDNYAIHAVAFGDRTAIFAQSSGYEGYAGIFDGKISTKVLEITGGSDLSEQFDIRRTTEGLLPSPGMVVIIDPENPGDLIVSHKANDKRVAGIISGAGGVNPGMLMGQKGSKADGANPVALTGRVYCLADASNGPIEPGDLLTTSNVPGHAMKVYDYERAQGAILGKAMSSLEGGKGMVLVLVTLQ